MSCDLIMKALLIIKAHHLSKNTSVWEMDTLQNTSLLKHFLDLGDKR